MEVGHHPVGAPRVGQRLPGAGEHQVGVLERVLLESHPLVHLGDRDGSSPGDVLVTPDVIVFEQPSPEPIIHRAVRKWSTTNNYYFDTKGDNNAGISPIDKKIIDQRVLGKALFRIPYLGQVKIKFTKYIACPLFPNTVGCV